MPAGHRFASSSQCYCLLLELTEPGGRELCCLSELAASVLSQSPLRVLRREAVLADAFTAGGSTNATQLASAYVEVPPGEDSAVLIVASAAPPSSESWLRRVVQEALVNTPEAQFVWCPLWCPSSLDPAELYSRLLGICNRGFVFAVAPPLPEMPRPPSLVFAVLWIWAGRRFAFAGDRVVARAMDTWKEAILCAAM